MNVVRGLKDKYVGSNNCCSKDESDIIDEI